MSERHDKLQALRQELAALEAEERSEELVRPSTIWVHAPDSGPHSGPSLVTVRSWESTTGLTAVIGGKFTQVVIGMTAWKTAKEAREAWLRKLQHAASEYRQVAVQAEAAAADYKLKWGLM